MRLGIACLFLGLFGCESSVDFCGGPPVCGVDGRTYEDRCAAASAGAEVESLGACAGECPPIACPALDCPGGKALDASGCETCVCACETREQCPGGDECIGGRCLGPMDAGVDGGCPEGQIYCEAFGACADPGDCSDCVCIDAPNTRCNRLCELVCDDGFEDCNDDIEGDGCEADLFDLETCGSCENTCSMPVLAMNGVTDCVPGGDGAPFCGFVCEDGFGDCNDTIADGCETTTDGNDRQNCGDCGNICGDNQACVDGVCEACPFGELLCDGDCKDVVGSPEHCGGCDIICPRGEDCIRGECLPDPCLNSESWSCSRTFSSCQCSCDGQSVVLDAEGGGSIDCFGLDVSICAEPAAVPGEPCALAESAINCCLGLP